jgi:prepilin-type N-terminal cleavage/methylation domain-containing protein
LDEEVSYRAQGGGFTLIELVTVVVIIGMLAAIALPNFRSTIYRADAAKIVTDLTAIRLAVFEFREDNSRLPGGGGWAQTPAVPAPGEGLGERELDPALRNSGSWCETDRPARPVPVFDRPMKRLLER